MEKNHAQNERSRSDEPIVLVEEIKKVESEFVKFCEDILKEPKPVPQTTLKTSEDANQTGNDVKQGSPVKTGGEDTDEGVTPGDGSKVMDLD